MDGLPTRARLRFFASVHARPLWSLSVEDLTNGEGSIWSRRRPGSAHGLRDAPPATASTRSRSRACQAARGERRTRGGGGPGPADPGSRACAHLTSVGWPEQTEGRLSYRRPSLAALLRRLPS